MMVNSIVDNLPEDWTIESMEQVCSNFSMGPFGSDIKTSNFVSFGVPVIRGINLSIPPFLEAGFVFLTERKADELKGANAFPNDLIFTHRGTLGQVGVIPAKGKFNRYVISQSQMKCSCAPNVLDPMFAFYFFSSNIGRNMIFENSSDSGVPHIVQPLKSLRKFSIILPPYPEQLKISQTLFEISKLISTIESLIQKKKNIKLGTIQELLTGKRKIEGFNAKWESEIIKNLVRITTGKSKSKFEDSNGEYLIMDMGSVSKEGKNISYKFTNNSEDLLEVGNIIMPKDDIGGGNIIGKTTVIDKNEKYVLGDHVYLLKTKNSRIIPKFLSYLINSYHVNKEIKSKVVGSAQLGLSKKNIEDIPLCFPSSIKEQTLMQDTLSDMDLEIESLQKQLIKYTQLKEGMMHNLLTGEIRLV